MLDFICNCDAVYGANSVRLNSSYNLSLHKVPFFLLIFLFGAFLAHLSMGMSESASNLIQNH